MNIIELKLSEIIPYEKNPRNNDKAIEPVAKSIEEFGFKVPIVIDSENVIVCGHTRYKAAQKLKLEKVPCIMADDLSEEQIKAFRLADNKTAELAEWDIDLLSEELFDISNIDMAEFGFDFASEICDESETEPVEHIPLIDRFIIPPFSVFDTKQGYWQARTKMWEKTIGIDSTSGRDSNLSGAPDKSKYMSTGCKGVAPQTSEFDPTCAEICYKFFAPKNGKILDCFAGGSVRGIVAEKLGYKYIGFDIREEQITENKIQAKLIGVNPEYIVDNSENVGQYIEDESIDMVFSCPPYFDLEKYSDIDGDLSNMDWERFKESYANIIAKVSCKLKKDSFFVFVLGDVRDKKGFYRDLLNYTSDCLNRSGLKKYNEIILLTQPGTAAIRAAKTFNAGRKLIKTHENILCFFKGDPQKIKQKYAEIDVSEVQ